MTQSINGVTFSMIHTIRLARFALPFAAAAFLSVTPARADEIGDAITAATKAYQAGELSGAKQQLDLASQLISEKVAEALIAALPKPLMGWKAGTPDTTAGGGFGLAVTQASNSYTNAKGESVEVTISSDSAFLGQLVAMLSNPQLAALMGKTVTIGSQRAIQTKEGEVQMMVNNRFVIQVNGGGTADDKLNYAKAIDFNVLIKMK
jgi:hypothetical protein